MIRNDPDVLMVGEIRDRETAQMAIESALTGHLVLSTLHTNDAPMAPARLIEMGIEPFLVATGLECVIAQRLARRLCEECQRPVKITAEELRDSGFEHDGRHRRLRAGRMRPLRRNRLSRPHRPLRGDGALEGAPLADPPTRRRATRSRDRRRGRGMRRLREDGLEKVRQGITSVPEVLRVLGT